MHAELRDILPDSTVIFNEEHCRVYESDGLTAFRQVPACVVIPNGVEDIMRVLRHCHNRGIPVVARGAGTGLSGGALPHPEGVLLSLARLNRILHIDPRQRLARVQPGVTNLKISEAVADLGLFYAPDPSSQIACTIGGNVAENSGGVHCLKYGLTVHNVAAVKVISASGELMHFGSECLDSPSYDLLALMHGSEGMLGVVVEVTVRLTPKPACSQVSLAAFAAVEDAGHAVADIMKAGLIPAGLEMMDRPCVAAVEAFAHVGYPLDAAAVLICELDGAADEVRTGMEALQEILQARRASSVRVARTANEGERMWAGRKAAFPAVGRISPDYYCMDGTIPRARIAETLRAIAKLSEESGLPVVNVFHAGDGNLHPLILYDISRPGELARVEEMGSRILEICIQCGGTITGEHGVGTEKLRGMCMQFNADELEQFHALRAAFDPNGILNPGKAVPTLSRCAEFGAMHVHGGELPHPDLERF
ncbi:MAG: FAD-linked oxidase C-terminal domain-containing protein [Candidatus Eutrophobiaceae bacterium]